MVAAAISTTDPEISKAGASKDKQTRRRQISSSAKDNNNEVEDNHKKPKSRVVSSRYTSPSNSACIASSPSSRKHCAPSGTKHSAATKLLVTSSRSLSVSFQGESYLSPISKPRIDPNMRIGTLDKRKTNTTALNQAEASVLKPLGDQYRWPARHRTLNTLSMIKEKSPSVNVLSSLDLGDPSTRLNITAKFWQEMNSRLRRLHDPDLSTSPVSKSIAPTKSRSNKYAPLSSSRTMSSPVMVREHSLYKIRNDVSLISSKHCETSSFHSFGVEKVGDNRNDDAKFLRLLYNRHLQWRFANARSEALLVVQKHRAQKNLWNAWITISDLRDTVTKRRHRVQLLKQKLKLTSILKGQMTYLEYWASLDKHHFISLLGCIEALKASTLQLPVLGGAIADVRSLKDAIVPAVDIMQSIASSISLLLPTVQEMNSLVTELVVVTAKERALLKQCTDFVYMLEAMQVKESRLRTHLLLLHNKVTPA